MTRTISKLFDNYDDARTAVRSLEAAGVPHDDISIVASNADDRYRNADDVRRDNEVGEDAAKGAGIGGTIGGAAGLLAGLGILAIPGVGPVVAAGWLAATAAGAAAGAVAGAATGGIVGAMTENGVDRADAEVYAEGVRRGGTLVTARVDDVKADALEMKLNQHHPSVNVQERGLAYRGAGWKGFDPAAKPYTPEEVRAERDRYRTMAP